MDRQQRGGNGAPVAAWLEWGNHPFAMMFWAVCGVLCAILAPKFIIGEKGGDRVDFWKAFAAIFATGLYGLGYLLRETAIMRERRVWFQNVLGNFCASAITIGVGVSYHKTPDSVIGFALVAVAVFAWMEIARPVFDFGLLQYFLRLPLQTAIVCYGQHVVGWHVVAAALLILCTVWNGFFVQIFAPLPPTVQPPPLQVPLLEQAPPPLQPPAHDELNDERREGWEEWEPTRSKPGVLSEASTDC